MITAWLRLDDIPGPNFRAILRESMSQQLPLVMIVDARSSAVSPTLDRIAVLLRLRRHARRRGGEIILVADHALRRRLYAAGLGTWLNVAHSAADAWLAVSKISPAASEPAASRRNPDRRKCSA